MHLAVSPEEAHGTAETVVVFHEAIDLHQASHAFNGFLEELLVGLDIAVDDRVVDVEDGYLTLFQAVAEEGVLVPIVTQARVKGYLFEHRATDQKVVGHERAVRVTAAYGGGLAFDMGAVVVAQAVKVVVAAVVIDAAANDDLRLSDRVTE